ncbi:MAG TPA: hypothetical protein PK440_14305 [Candidatus Accumulibacter phosphatis]|jgi:hypothetical protein|nr:hypothetical protein [Candidatus Accumulibacter phosphatis]
MTENVLHLGELDARLDEVRGIGVAQAVGRNVLLYTAFSYPDWAPQTRMSENCAFPTGVKPWN